MTEELKEQLDRQLKHAQESNNPQDFYNVLCDATAALIDCQMKTSKRVKESREDIYEMKRDVATRFADMRESYRTFCNGVEEKLDSIQDSIRSMKDKSSGAMAMLKLILKIAALSGGSVGAAGLAKVMGVL